MGEIVKFTGSRNRYMVGGVAILLVLCVAIDHWVTNLGVHGLPVSAPKEKTQSNAEHKDETTNYGNDSGGETALEYDRYLREVVQTLESDPDFRKKLDEAPEADIRVCHY